MSLKLVQMSLRASNKTNEKAHQPLKTKQSHHTTAFPISSLIGPEKNYTKWILVQSHPSHTKNIAYCRPNINQHTTLNHMNSNGDDFAR